jgi:protein-tyrosine phosphatase
MIITSREISKITEQIYIGSYASASALDHSNTEGITHVLNCTTDPHEGLKNLEVYQININDGFEISPEYIRFALTIMAKAIHNGGKILVHCHAGVSRSTSLVCAHFIQAGFSWDEAVSYVRLKRPQMFPHPNIERSIKNFFGNNVNATTTMLGEK